MFDISNPTSPQQIADCHVPDRCEEMCLDGNYAYMAAWSAGLRIIDIRNPYSPVEVGHCSSPSTAMGVAVKGGYAYVGNDQAGFAIIDVSDPSNPSQVGSCDTPGSALRVALSASCAIVSDWQCGFRVICVSDPSNPFEVGYYDTPGNECTALFAVGDLAYSADETLFGVFDCSRALPVENKEQLLLPTAFSLLPNCPNPFNASTVISYSLLHPGMVTLTIHNILGQRVATLFRGRQQSGVHTITWDASDVSSGIYFARLDNGTQMKCTKMILLK